jgi:hypothetical protein
MKIAYCLFQCKSTFLTFIVFFLIFFQYFLGKWSAGFGVTKESLCVSCGTGKYGQNIEGANSASSCKECVRGKYLDSVGSFGNETCMVCPPGFIQSNSGQAFCLPCMSGSYNSKDGMAECSQCIAGRWSSTVARTDDCDVCAQGRYQPSNGATACLNCIPGKNQPQQEQVTCIDCAVGRASSFVARDTDCDACTQGRYQPDTGTTACLKCIPGRYQSSTTQSDCIDCPKNTFVAKTQQIACEECMIGKFTDGTSSTSCISCGAGQYGIGSGCQLCPGGWKRNDEDDLKQCIQCILGKTTSDEGGAKTCQDCSIGEYGSTKGSCTPCRGANEFQNNEGQVSCKQCKPGNIPNTEHTSCIDPPWNTPQDCKSSEYLNDSARFKQNWTCTPCPEGAACYEFVDINEKYIKVLPNASLSNIYSMPGYWKVPTEYGPGQDLFSRCPFPKDCQYNTSTGITCVEGTRADLCSRCVVGYDRTSSKCRPCAQEEVTIRVTLLIALVIVIIVLLAKARKKLQRLHRRYVSAVRDSMLAIKVIISFLQINFSMPTMMSSFEYPSNYRTFLNRLSFVNVDFLSVIGVSALLVCGFIFCLSRVL